MNNIRRIELSDDNFIIHHDETSLKLTYKDSPEKYIVDISNMNLLKATRVAILCSTYCFINNFKKKIQWVVSDFETQKAISILRLRNIEAIVQKAKEKKQGVSYEIA